MAYNVLATYYERLRDDNDYRLWADYIIKLLNKYADGNVGVDLGCGTGYFTRAINNASYDITGLDCSVEMLNVALSRENESQQINYLEQDITKFNGFNNLDFCVSINDVLNYVKPKKILEVLQRVNKSLKTGGIFIFDFSSAYKLKEILNNNVFCEDYDDFTYVWFNKLYRDRVEMQLSFFISENFNDSYTRYDETHTQYIIDDNQMDEDIVNCGFRIIKKSGYLGSRITEKCDRICYVIKKEKEV